MGPDHEYSLLSGVNRSLIGRWLGMIAAGVSSGIILCVLALINLAKLLGVANYVPQLILWPIGAGVIYGVLYWIFNSYLWKHPKMALILKLPDLSGNWKCEGQSLNSDKTLSWSWDGTMTITQSWDKIKIRIRTEKSRSVSIAAALMHDEADGYRLIYHYQNTPNIDEPELNVHRGFSELNFHPDLKIATGEYINGQGRFTFGIMKLSRI